MSSSDAASRLRHAEERVEELKAVAAERGSACCDLVVLHQGCSLRMLTLRLKPLQGSELYNWRCNVLNYRVPTHNCCASPSPLLALQRS